MILVTGGTGLLGSHLIQNLIAQGKPVRALKRSHSNLSLLNNYSKHVDWVEGDVRDIISLEEALEGIEQVYHCAAVVSFAPSLRHEMKKTNVEGTSNILNLAIQQGVRKFVHVSSIAALGRTVEGLEIDEKVKWENNKNNSYYSYTKFLAEKEVWRAMAEGLNCIIVNPALILGAGNFQNDSSSLFSKIWNGLPFYPTGMNGFVDVDDVVSAMVKLMESDIINEQFVLSGSNLTYKKVFSEIASNFKKRPPNIAVNRIMGSLAWRMATFKSFITKKESIITRETIRTSRKIFKYNNQKIRKAIDIEFTPIEKTVRKICDQFPRNAEHSIQ